MAQKILLVDDSSFMRSVLKKVLIKEGYKDFCEASNGSEAIKQYKKEKPGLVLLDLIIGKKQSGIDILKKIKEYDPLSSVIIVSVVDQVSVENKVKRLGALEFIRKPIDEKKFVAAVKRSMPILSKKDKANLQRTSDFNSQKIAKSLEKWIKSPVTVKSSADIVHFRNVESHIKIKKDVLVTYVVAKTSGISLGSVLMVMPKVDGFRLVGHLLKKELKEKKTLSKEEKSAILETLNLLGGNSLNAFVKMSRVSIDSTQPKLYTGEDLKKIIDYMTKRNYSGNGLIFVTELTISKLKAKIQVYSLIEKQLLKSVR